MSKRTDEPAGNEETIDQPPELVKEREIQISAKVPDSLHRRVRMYAFANGFTVQTVVANAIADYMARNEL